VNKFAINLHLLHIYTKHLTIKLQFLAIDPAVKYFKKIYRRD